MPGHYLAAAAALWVTVTPATMLDPVPEFAWIGIPGSVQPAEWRKAKPIEACPIYDESGRVVGASLACTKEQS